MTVYGYIRVSTAKQVAEDSPDTQRMTIEQLALENGLLVDRYFEDDAISGKTEPEKRPGFGALVNRIKTGDTVIMSQLNRVARRWDVLQDIISSWRRVGIRVLVKNEMDQQAYDDPIMLGVICRMADLKLKEVSITTKTGMARVARETDAERQAKHKNRIGRPAKNQWYNKQDIIDALNRGERPDAVAKQFGIGVATVYRIRNPKTRTPTRKNHPRKAKAAATAVA
ncbi:TPA: recombinase family protein [Escherichia coli]|nr:recombinase family protein [Escherichia coli]